MEMALSEGYEAKDQGAETDKKTPVGKFLSNYWRFGVKKEN
jgi:hypothetical protein